MEAALTGLEDIILRAHSQVGHYLFDPVQTSPLSVEMGVHRLHNPENLAGQA